MGEVRVAVIGARYADLEIEQRILGPKGAQLVRGDGADRDSILRDAGDAAIILTGSAPSFDRPLLERLTCRGIVRYGVGVDRVDLDAAASTGKWVAFVPDYGTDAVATHTVALILGGARRLPQADLAVKTGRWQWSGLRPMHELSTLTVGIVGFGRIGRRVSEMLVPFGPRLVAHDILSEVGGPGVERVSFERLLEESDIVTLHLPGAADGSPLLARSELDGMKEGSMLVNTARGSLVDQEALLKGLIAGTPAYAALDVFEQEPVEAVFEAVSDRVLLTPHMAWYTEESERDLRTKASLEAVRLLEGKAPLNVVARPRSEP
jgi:D-3-phosphoglycerate dehydrogenase